MAAPSERRRLSARGLVAGALLSAALAAPSSARAQARPSVPASAQVQEARALFAQGLAAADGERWGEAVLFFQRSLALVPRPSTQLNLGNALVRMGRALEAQAQLEAYLAAADPRRDGASVATARALLAEATGAVATVRVSVRGAGAPGAPLRCALDGQPRELAREPDGALVLRVDPGAHTLVARASDGAEGAAQWSALPGARVEAVLELRAAPPAAPTRTTARLRVSGAPSSAVLRVDGVAREGFREGVELDAGAHELALEGPGLAPLRRRVVLEAGSEFELLAVTSPTRVEAPRPRGIASSPVFWGLVGLGVVAAAAVPTGYFLLRPAEPSGTTGVVLTALEAAP